MTDAENADVAVWLLVIVAFLLGLLAVTGLLQYRRTGDVGVVLRNAGIGAVLLAFGVGLYRKWTNE